jgi:ribosome-associated protein
MAKSARAPKIVVRPASEILEEVVIKGLQEKKAHNIISLDLRNIKTAVADFFIVCHGDSTTQVEALARSVEVTVEKNLQESPVHLEGIQNAQWVLIDYINVVVHVFLSETRDYYGIERLWADAETRHIESNE